MRTLTTIFAAATILCGTMLAQMANSINVRFSTPVMIGETLVPAGDCHIQIDRGSSDTVTLIFRSEAGPAAAVVVNRIVESNESNEGVRVVLRRGATQNKLDRLMLGDGTGFQVIGQ